MVEVLMVVEVPREEYELYPLPPKFGLLTLVVHPGVNPSFYLLC